LAEMSDAPDKCIE